MSSYHFCYQAAFIAIQVRQGKISPARAEFSADHFVIFHSSVLLIRSNPPLTEAHSLLRKKPGRSKINNDHDQTDSSDFTELTRCEHRDANAPVAGWRSGNRWIAVNGYAAMDVIWVVEQSEGTFSPAFDLVINLEPARRSDSLPSHASFGKKLAEIG